MFSNPVLAACIDSRFVRKLVKAETTGQKP